MSWNGKVDLLDEVRPRAWRVSEDWTTMTGQDGGVGGGGGASS